MYLWRKTAGLRWLSAREERLQARARGALAIIARPGRKHVQIEIACTSRNESRKLVQEFGGRAKKLRRDWLKGFAHKEKPKPLRIGKRLVIVRSLTKREAGSFPHSLIVPAGAAFGTGEHATTAMSLRLLEEVTRGTEPKFVVDLGTGSGILALAAKCFGACRVVGIDVDRTAICAPVEADCRDRNRHRESLQRITDRDPAKTKTKQLADALRRFARPGERIPSRSTSPQDRDRRSASPREMDRSFSEK